MVSIDNARVATCVVAAALAGASAAAFPSVAWADESAGPAASVPMPDVPAAATTDVGSVVGAAETDALGEAITTALDAAVGVEDAPPESPSPDPQDVTAASVPESAPSADSGIYAGLCARAAGVPNLRYQRKRSRYHRRYRRGGRFPLSHVGCVSPRGGRSVRAA